MGFYLRFHTILSYSIKLAYRLIWSMCKLSFNIVRLVYGLLPQTLVKEILLNIDVSSLCSFSTILNRRVKALISIGHSENRCSVVSRSTTRDLTDGDIADVGVLNRPDGDLSFAPGLAFLEDLVRAEVPPDVFFNWWSFLPDLALDTKSLVLNSAIKLRIGIYSPLMSLKLLKSLNASSINNSAFTIMKLRQERVEKQNDSFLPVSNCKFSIFLVKVENFLWLSVSTRLDDVVILRSPCWPLRWLVQSVHPSFLDMSISISSPSFLNCSKTMWKFCKMTYLSLISFWIPNCSEARDCWVNCISFNRESMNSKSTNSSLPDSDLATSICYCISYHTGCTLSIWILNSYIRYSGYI